MGCCYGIGILGHHLGAEVSKRRFGEPVGPVTCRVTVEGAADPLVAGLPGAFDAFVGHKEAVQELPEGCVHLLASDPSPYQLLRYGQHPDATQFPPGPAAAVVDARLRTYRHKGGFRPETAADLPAR